MVGGAGGETRVRGTDGGEGPKGIGIGVRREPGQDQPSEGSGSRKG